MEYYRIDAESEIPKYKQVVDMIISDIESGIFKQGQRIPSINETSEELLLSRDTVEKAYVFLRKKGILSSVRGKGYYVKNINVGKKIKVCLIFNKLSNYKRNLYASFVEAVGTKASVDVFIYNYDILQFKEIIDNNINDYDYFVILPHFRDEKADVASIIKNISKEKVLIIDRFISELKDYPVVYQEYDKDIQQALSEAVDLLKKYKRLQLVFPKNEFYSPHIARGFQVFCQINDFDFQIVNSVTEENISKEDVYIIVSDNDLYELLKYLKAKGWDPGKDIGIVSYNDTAVKELLCDGITTISTNHDQIGKIAAEMILSKNFKQIKSPFEFVKRKSL